MNTHHNNEYIWVDSETGQEGGRCRVEVMTLTITPNSNEDSKDEDLIYGDDRQIIDSTEWLTVTDPQNTSTYTNPRRDLTETIQRLEPNLVHAVLPLP